LNSQFLLLFLSSFLNSQDDSVLFLGFVCSDSKIIIQRPSQAKKLRMEQVQKNVLVKTDEKGSELLRKDQTVRGFDFEEYTVQQNGKTEVDYHKLFEAYKTIGFQATSLGEAIEEINKMLKWRLSDEPIDPNEDESLKDPKVRGSIKCKIFLGYTSNMISAGIRETIRFLVKNKLIDCIVTTAGGIEEDFIKCMAPTYLGDFSLSGAELRLKGINRIGNLLVPNDNYCKFEDWIMPILDQMLLEQKTQGVVWTSSKLIHRLGKEINHPDSVYYWAYKNNIPVFCPAITDGSVGDMLYFHSFKNPGLIVDLVGDIRELNNLAAFAKRSGMIILGGGVVKHHICNANLMRNGADYSVFINTGQEFDGSDTGAKPDEAKSWGKIKLTTKGIKVYADASLVFPIIVAQTFAPYFYETLQKK
jgi:deoxyhypusine synthase